jgi:cytochrome c553
MLKSCCLLVVVLLACTSVRIANSQTQAESKPGAPPPAPAAGPVIPDKFTNLQVLPKQIQKNDLMAIMKGFSMTFKVRCSHCHVATDDLSSADFPSDEKPTKQSARELLRRIMEVQQKYSAGSSSSVFLK